MMQRLAAFVPLSFLRCHPLKLLHVLITPRVLRPTTSIYPANHNLRAYIRVRDSPFLCICGPHRSELRSFFWISERSSLFLGSPTQGNNNESRITHFIIKQQLEDEPPGRDKQTCHMERPR
ncbi:hypothetical protein EV401DRAFT_503849 [Pisolithus croceorrhizus]|nr:hypothetical protein EV401DRAFT_503849 [Pisolithus croceorrhizus]